MDEKKKVNWKDADLEKVVNRDLQCAIALLCMIRDNQAILEGIVGILEDIRDREIKDERIEKKAKENGVNVS